MDENILSREGLVRNIYGRLDHIANGDIVEMDIGEQPLVPSPNTFPEESSDGGYLLPEEW